MSRSRLRVAIACLLALACTYSTTVIGQDDEGRRRRGGDRGGREGGDRGGRQRSSRGFGGFSRTMNKMALVAVEQVQKELKIEEKQVKEIEGIATANRDAQRELFEKMRDRDATSEEREKMRAEFEKIRATQRTESDKKLAGILDKKQVKRLSEIHVQQQGIRALTTDEVIAALKLSDEQVTKIKDLIAKGDEEKRELFGGFGRGGRDRGGAGGRERGGRERGGRGGEGRERRRPSGEDNFAPDEEDEKDEEKKKPEPREGRERGGREGRERGGFGGFEEIREKMAAIDKKTDEACMKVLSKKQNEQFVSMKGEKFELDRRAMFRRGSSRGGGDFRRGGSRGGEGGDRGRRRRPGDDEEEI